MSSLNFDELDDDEPVVPMPSSKDMARINKDVPSRPVVYAKEEQTRILVHGPESTIERFKKLCKDDRRSYHDMLRILMDAFEAK